MGAMAMRNANGSRSLSIWSLVLALSVIAFWRTIAPERSARAIQRFLNQRENLRVTTNKTDDQFGELKRLRASIRREKRALLALREEIKKLNISGSDLLQNGPTALGATIKRRSEVVEIERKEIEPTEQLEDSIDQQEDQDALNDCDMVLAPIAAEAGLGTQTEHLWKQLSLAKALNACVALPPVVARTAAQLKYVPIHEVFNVGPLLDLVRIVPLAACKNKGVGALIGDGITTDAYSDYVKNSDPVLAAETVLVNNVTTATGFVENSELSDQVSIVRKAASFCIGTGKMSATITFDDEVLKLLDSASRISSYVIDRFRGIEDNLFVRLRWRKSTCKDTPEDFICFGDASTVPISDYVAAIKEKAKQIEAKSIYISSPPTVPLEVMKYFTESIETIDNVMLRLEGDEFAANVVEREMALRSKAFVNDGGIWGATIQNKRRLRRLETYEENASSSEMMKSWEEIGKPSNEDVFVPSHVQEKNEQEMTEGTQPEEPQPEDGNQDGDQQAESGEENSEQQQEDIGTQENEGDSQDSSEQAGEPDVNTENSEEQGRIATEDNGEGYQEPSQDAEQPPINDENTEEQGTTDSPESAGESEESANVDEGAPFGEADIEQIDEGSNSEGTKDSTENQEPGEDPAPFVGNESQEGEEQFSDGNDILNDGGQADEPTTDS